MTAYLINHLRQPGVLHREVLEYLDRVQATILVDGVDPDHTPGKFAQKLWDLSATRVIESARAPVANINVGTNLDLPEPITRRPLRRHSPVRSLV